MAVRDDFGAGEVLAAADLNDTFASKLDLAGGKILQIVRATDGTDRSTTSTSLVDASISVTITPQYNTSAILLIWSGIQRAFNGSQNVSIFAITDASNNVISGAEGGLVGFGLNNTFRSIVFCIGYATPATTSATTYKGRFAVAVSGSTTEIENATQTGQLYAIEVST